MAFPPHNPGGSGTGTGTGSGSGSGSGGGSSSKPSTAGAWDKLSPQDKANIIGGFNDTAMQILGRRISSSEAKRFYQNGWGNYTVGQFLIHHNIKAWMRSGAPMGGKNMLANAQDALISLGVQPGTVKFNAKQLASFAAHGWTQTDIQGWAMRQPKIFVHTQQYAQNFNSMQQVYANAFGLQNVDPSSWGEKSTQVRVDTNKKKKGIQGNKFNTVLGAPGSEDPLSQHIQAAALHFQSPDQYQQWLQKQPAYRTYQQQTIAPSQDNQVQGQGPSAFQQQQRSADTGA